VRAASRAGLAAIAVTDHDSVAALEVATRQGARSAVTVIPGVELSSRVLGSTEEIHILGYFVDPSDPVLRKYLAALARVRRQRARLILAKMTELGLPPLTEEAAAESRGGRIGRAHLARALVRKGIVPTSDEAFRRYLGRGACCYVAKPAPDPLRTVQFIREVGGVAVIAHPGLLAGPLDLDALCRAGLGGIEVVHPEHSPGDSARWSALARDRGLVATGGSDWHGARGPHAGTLGTLYVDARVVDQLRDRRRSRAALVDAPRLLASEAPADGPGS
jgi:3',5'-nucleoside bisphosphate phosphatase